MKPSLTLLAALLLAPLAAHAQHAVVATRPEPDGSNRTVQFAKVTKTMLANDP